MKAMILAAGLGTRLRPLTDDRPKALVEVAGRTLLEITLGRLRSFGVSEVIINVHHFAEMIVDYLKANDSFGMRVEISREDELLDTGGGLKKAAPFFLETAGDSQSPFLVHNVDVISTIDLTRMLHFHAENQALATLAVQDRESSRYLLFDSHSRLCGRRSARNPKAEIVRPVAQVEQLGFCGIHVISPNIFPLMRQQGAFSITDFYLELAAKGERMVGFRADEYYWRDAGTVAGLQQAAEDVDRWTRD
ncbi:MAG: nucleotidyltransferase family protein [Candidatus Korobacteraceae bacterium]